MKNVLLPLCLACVAASASAQSSVQLFGTVDVGVAYLTGTDVSKVGVSTGGANISRIGFRGTEDLGGGLSASFWLEAGMDVDSGAGKTGGALSFNRRSTVSLAGSYGELRLGRDDAATFLNTLIFDPFLTNGVGGTMAFTMFGIPGTGTPPGGAPIQISNAISYFLPRDLAGFYGQLQIAMGEQQETPTNKKDWGNYQGLRFGYAKGALNTAVGLGRLEGTIDAADLSAANVGISYDFGMVKPMFLWSRETKNSNNITATQIGFTAPIGVGQLRASYGYYNSSNSNADWTKVAVGYGYNLSKRTQIYGTVAFIDNKAGAQKSIGVQGLSAPGTSLGGTSTGIETGIRHFF